MGGGQQGRYEGSGGFFGGEMSMRIDLDLFHQSNFFFFFSKDVFVLTS